MNPFRASLLFLTLSAAAAAEAGALGGGRQGFVLGFGAGGGTVTSKIASDSNTGLQTDLKIGAGISPRLLVHYSGKQFWIKENGDFFTLATPMAALTYYARDTSPSVLVSWGAGPALAAAIWQDELGAALGVGTFAGVGYEVAPHWEVEFNVLRSQFVQEGLWSFSLTLNLLGY